VRKQFAVFVLVCIIAVFAFASGAELAKGPALKFMDTALRQFELRTGRAASDAGFGGNPITGFYARGVRIDGATPDGPPAAVIEKLRFRISLPDLLKGKVLIKSVEAIHPAIRIERSADGALDIAGILETFVAPAAADGVFSAPRLDRVSISGGKIIIKIHRRNAAAATIVISDLDAALRPSKPGDFTSANAKFTALIGKIRFSGGGKVRFDGENAFDLNWKTGAFTIEKIPGLEKTIAALKSDFGAGADMSARGTVRGTIADPNVRGDIRVKNCRAFGIAFGAGAANLRFERGGLSFTGALKSDDNSFGFSGRLSPGAKNPIDIGAAFDGIDVDLLAESFSPNQPQTITGLAGGIARFTGKFFDLKEMDIDANLTVRNGTLTYPTLSLHERKPARAELPFGALKIVLYHHRGDIDIKEFALKSPILNASGKADILYITDAMTGEASGPFVFDAEAEMSGPDIRLILEKNPYIGTLVSGAFAASVDLKGRTDKPKEWTGGIRFSIADGEILSPYSNDAARFPPDFNLTHFAFDRTDGVMTIAGGAIGIPSLRMRAKLIEFDLVGRVGFDGKVIARADSSIPPSILWTVEALRKISTELNNLGGLERVKAYFELGGDVWAPVVAWDEDELRRLDKETGEKKKADELIKKVEQKRKERHRRRSRR
jgi:hypothetical protein